MLVSLIRTIILYLTLVTVIRLMGKRQLGQMEPSEFVVTLLIADLASVPMQDLGIPLLSGVIPILIILCLEILLSALSYHSILFRKILCGKPVILMENGKILAKSLDQTRLTPEELKEHLREKGVVDLKTVKFAILETNGQISVLLNPEDQPLTAKDVKVQTDTLELPITLISCGRLLKDNLGVAGRSSKWLDNVLKKNHCTIHDVLLLTVEPSGKLYLALREDA